MTLKNSIKLIIRHLKPSLSGHGPKTQPGLSFMSCLKLKVWPVLSVPLMSRGADRVERVINAALEATSEDTVLSVADLCVRVYRIEPSMVGKRHRVAVLRAFGQGQQGCAWSPSSVPKNVMTSSSRHA